MTREVGNEPTADGDASGDIHFRVRNKLCELYEDLVRHDGYGEMRLEIRILRRRQKEVIIHCGKQYRFIVDYPDGERRKVSQPYSGGDRRRMESRAEREGEVKGCPDG
jgi:hypothetical protein